MESLNWTWKSRDGLDMSAFCWSPAVPKAVVVLVHGHGEHVKRYQHVAATFTELGYVFVGYDLRGHGKSSGPRGHTPNYEALMNDISDFIADAKMKYPGLPVFLYGHSMGGNQVINYALRRPSGLSGVIATGPWLRLAFDPPAVQLMAAKVLDNILPAFSLSSGLDQSALSRDGEVVQKYAADPLVHDKISARLYNEMYANGLWALDNAAKLELPLLLMHGSADRLTSAPASQEFARRADKFIQIRIWDGLFHEIHNEPEKAEVMGVMLKWLDEVVAA